MTGRILRVELRRGNAGWLALGLLTSYSKRADLLYDLQEVLRQLRQASTDDMPPSVRSVRSPDRKGQVWALADRLSEEDRRKIVQSFEAGECRADIAKRHNISLSSVGRVLRAWRERGKQTPRLHVPYSPRAPIANGRKA